MRRALAAALAAALLLPSAASAHPGHAIAEVDVGQNRFEPAEIEIFVGDGINWVFRGPDTNHSITADPGQIESFDSDPGEAYPVHAIDDVYYHDFYGLGTYTYHCKVHPEMRGSITVRRPQPPVLSSAAVKPGKLCNGPSCPKPDLRVKVDHAVNIIGDIERRGKRWREVRELPPRAVEGGKSSVPLDIKGLSPGRYRAVVRARDDFGMFSDPQRAKFEIRAD
jgi:plastocyanin